MVLNNLFPVFALLLFGHLLKRVGLTDDAFLKTADKLIYYIFFPALLFWKIGAAASDQVGDPGRVELLEASPSAAPGSRGRGRGRAARRGGLRSAEPR